MSRITIDLTYTEIRSIALCSHIVMKISPVAKLVWKETLRYLANFVLLCAIIILVRYV